MYSFMVGINQHFYYQLFCFDIALIMFEIFIYQLSLISIRKSDNKPVINSKGRVIVKSTRHETIKGNSIDL